MLQPNTHGGNLDAFLCGLTLCHRGDVHMVCTTLLLQAQPFLRHLHPRPHSFHDNGFSEFKGTTTAIARHRLYLWSGNCHFSVQSFILKLIVHTLGLYPVAGRSNCTLCCSLFLPSFRLILCGSICLFEVELWNYIACLMVQRLCTLVPPLLALKKEVTIVYFLELPCCHFLCR